MSDEQEKSASSPKAQTRRLKDPEKGAEAISADVSSMPFFQTKSLIGVQIDSWRLEALLGEGGMSAVYLAKHMWLQQEAAVKVLLPEYCRDVDVLARFQQEALAVSRLSHPNIIEVKDFGVDPNHGFYMVLEYLRGQDLESVIDKAPFPKSWLLHLFERICRGLHLTHEEGIIHRDLKPSNIFLVPDGKLPQVKILDFGVAKVQFQDQEREASKLTKTGIVVGTPAYLAPEQISPQGEITRTSDIYALGVILYQCLTGKLPLSADNAVGFLLKVLQEEPPPVGELRPALAGTPLEALVASMLHKAPHLRPQSTLEVWKELKAAAAQFEDGRDQASFYPTIDVAEPQKRQRSVESFSFDESQVNILPTGAGETGLMATRAAESGATAAAPSGSSRGLITGVVALLLAAVVGVVSVVAGWWDKTPPPKKRVVARVIKKPQRSLLDDLIIKGRKALKQKRYLAAARIWKRALRQKGARKSLHYPKIYRAIGYAYREKNWLHSAVHYFDKYKELVKQQREKIKALRQQMAQAKDDASKREQLDQALQALLSRLPKEEQFKKDFRNLTSLREGLRERCSAGAKLLAGFRKQWSAKRWKASLDSLRQVMKEAPSVPSLHLELARMLATPFLGRALSILKNIKRDMSPSEPQQAALDALEKKLKQRQATQHKRWQDALADATRLLKAGQVRKALGILRKLLSSPKELAEGSVHRMWRTWLKAQTLAMPRKMRPVWRLYARTIKQLKQKGLWVWLQAHDEAALSAKEIGRMLQWLSQIERAKKRFARGEALFQKGSLYAARKVLKQFLREGAIPKDKDPWALAAQVNAMRKRAAGMIATLDRAIPLFQKLQQAHGQALFVDAAKHREAVKATLQGTAALAGLTPLFERQSKAQLRAEQALSQGHSAFSRYRWKRARRHYRAYLALFPKAFIKPSLDKRLKTCRCALHIYPWETCDKLKIPKRFRRKRSPKRP